MKKEKRDLSRRTFLTGATVAGIAAIGASMVGCGPNGGADVAGDAAGTATSSAAESADFAIAPVRLADAGEPAYTCDYLVIGGGNCGMMSAAHAGSLGLSTIVLEKNSVTGGSSVGTEVTMGLSDCRIFQETKEDPEVIYLAPETGSYNDIYTYFMMHNSWESNAELVSNYIRNNHRQHDFLFEHGAYPMMVLGSLDSPTGGIMYKGQGIGAFEVMQAAAEQYGVTILTSTPAVALVIDDAETVVGVMAEENDAEIHVAAKAVFIGTGGFSNNAEMVEHYIGEHGTIAWRNDGHIRHDGDGIRMLLGVGAVESDMSLAQPAASSVANVTWETAIDKAAREPYLWVNRVGKRLGNEKWNVMDTMFKVGIKENGHTYFNIIDSAAVTRMETQDFITNGRTVLGDPSGDPQMAAALEEGVKEGLIYKGETIEELAEAAGIDGAALSATVAEYNAMVAVGEDAQFFKATDYLFSIEQGPFYAFELIPAWYSTLNGVKINGNIEVVDAEGKAIPGLYAGGLDSGEFFKDNYNHGFSGSCSGFSYFTGFYAADMAATYIQG